MTPSRIQQLKQNASPELMEALTAVEFLQHELALARRDSEADHSSLNAAGKFAAEMATELANAAKDVRRMDWGIKHPTRFSKLVCQSAAGDERRSIDEFMEPISLSPLEQEWESVKATNPQHTRCGHHDRSEQPWRRCFRPDGHAGEHLV